MRVVERENGIEKEREVTKKQETGRTEGIEVGEQTLAGERVVLNEGVVRLLVLHLQIDTDHPAVQNPDGSTISNLLTEANNVLNSGIRNNNNHSNNIQFKAAANLPFLP